MVNEREIIQIMYFLHLTCPRDQVVPGAETAGQYRKTARLVDLGPGCTENVLAPRMYSFQPLATWYW